MDQSTSANLATEVIGFLDGMPKSPIEEPSSARTPIFFSAFDFVPDDATAAVIPLGASGEPAVAAVHARQLFLITLEQDQQGSPKANTRLINLDPLKHRVSVLAGFRGDHRYPTRSLEWKFDLGDEVRLEITSVTAHEDGDFGLPARFAQALAEALGWPEPEQSQRG